MVINCSSDIKNSMINIQKKMKKKYLFILSTIVLLGFANCNKDNNEPEPEPIAPVQILVSEEYAIGTGLKISYYSDEDPFVGYNKIYFTVKDSITGETISNDLEITILPMMDMGTTQHSCPTEAVVHNSETNQYETAIVYVMPSNPGTWTLTATVINNSNGDSGVALFNFDVVQPDEAKLTSFVSNLDPTASYFISLIQPTDPKVGENEFEILINRRASMMSWPYEPYLTVEIDPQMPAMNHGSPNNVNPVHIGNGHYKGVANFTMTGWWRINMLIKDGEGSVLTDDVYLDITFQ
jgi:hypothetical protein